MKIESLLNSDIFNSFLIFLILTNLIVFVLATDVNIDKSYGTIIYYFDLFSVIIFTIEYCFRILTLKSPKDIFKPLMLVDLFAILPFYLSFIKINTIFLRVLRMCRLLRIFKIERYIYAIKNIARCFERRKDELIVTFMIFVAGVLFFATLMYFTEGQINPRGFGSIPRASWWAVITCTTVGYGDVCPISALGKIIASITAVFGACLHGILIGIMSIAFMDVLHEREKRQTLEKDSSESSVTVSQNL